MLFLYFQSRKLMQNMHKKKSNAGFDLKAFVMAHFHFLGAKVSIQREDHLPIKEHIEKLWDELTRTAYEEKGTLLKLPKPYIVPEDVLMNFSTGTVILSCWDYRFPEEWK